MGYSIFRQTHTGKVMWHFAGLVLDCAHPHMGGGTMEAADGVATDGSNIWRREFRNIFALYIYMYIYIYIYIYISMSTINLRDSGPFLGDRWIWFRHL